MKRFNRIVCSFLTVCLLSGASGINAHAAYLDFNNKDIVPNGTIDNISLDLYADDPTISQNNLGIWTVNMPVNSKIQINCFVPSSKDYVPVFISKVGVVNGEINKAGCIEISSTSVGSGVVAFQYKDKDGNLVGKPLQIAVLVNDYLNPYECAKDYYSDAVFSGDSIMLGLRNYAMKSKDSFFSQADYLAAGSYSLRYANNKKNEKELHPMYKGEQRVIWESIKMMGAKKVFLFFGVNDINILGNDGTIEYYQKLVGQIKEANPDVEIHVISMTYVVAGKDSGKLNNDNIREFNKALKATAEKEGWGYVDLASAIQDDKGNLMASYCSDNFIHHSNSCYQQAWTQVFQDYAVAQTTKED